MNDEILVLIKIGRREFTRKTYSEGQFYMNTSKYFNEMAHDNPDTLIGDIHESSFPRGFTLSINNINLTPFGDDDDCCAMNLGVSTCLYCTYAVSRSVCIIKDGSFQFTISKELIRDFVGEKDPNLFEVLLFLNPDEIIERVRRRVIEIGLPFRAALVNYDDHIFHVAPRMIIDNINKFALELCFHKCHKYKKQNEFRIAVINTEDKARADIVIGQFKISEYRTFPVTLGKDYVFQIHVKPGEEKVIEVK